MTGKNAVVVLIMLLAFSFCSKGKANAPAAAAGQADRARVGQQAAGEAALQIKSISLLPETPTVLDDVTAVPLLADPGLENVTFQYQWFVNGQENQEIENDKLGKAFLKKGTWIFCRVKAAIDGLESPWLKSDVIRVLNSLPVLALAPVVNFGVPGDFKYQAAASDADGDDLTFEVLAPLDQGIEIDPRSGALSWKLTEEIVKALGDSIEIKIAVSDGESEKITGTITLNLAKTK